ncbi:MAG: DNA primase [Tannerella sp.]|jgi:DNA primase|nr:DNA primase [Tannerella sp.]
MIDQATIDRILNAATIADVVSEFVTLRRRGVNLVGLCPFHPDKTPSFYVSPAKNICKCFSCGEGGDPLHFIMKHEQLSFQDALRFLAKKYHIEFEEKELTDEEKRAQGDRESMFIVNSWAQKYFTSRLLEHEEGKTVGLAYFNERGFREDIIRKFQLGYSLEKRDDLCRTALKNGYRQAFLEKTGLVSFHEDGTAHDRFRGRVIFPIHTLSGKVVAFGGRILRKSDKTAKYINSPESDIYHKSNELYGIYFARNAIRKEDRCYLVEGYTDVISMHQAGLENVVAPCGTALTQGQIRMIHRLTDNITVLYDGDAAGIKAAIRGIDLFLEEGMNVKVLLLPDGEDPDSFARKNSAGEFTGYIREHETDFIRFKAGLLLSEAGDDPIKRASLITDIIRSIAVIPEGIIRTEYVKECSRMLDVREQVLISALNKERDKRHNALRKTRQETPAPPPAAEPEKEDSPPEEAVVPVVRKTEMSPYRAYEETLLRYVIYSGEQILFDYMEGEEHRLVRVAEYIRSELQHDEITFSVPVHQQIMEEAVIRCQEPDFTASRHFLSHPDPEISRTTILLMDPVYPFHFDAVWKARDAFVAQRETVAPLLQKEMQDEEPTRHEMETLQELKEKERELLKQIDLFEHTLRRDLFALKEVHIRQKIAEIKHKIKDLQQEGKIDEIIELMKEQTHLNELKIELSRELGERIILPPTHTGRHPQPPVIHH